jgi:hypothetical protein
VKYTPGVLSFVRNGARFAAERAEVRQNGRPQQAATHAGTQKLRKGGQWRPICLPTNFIFIFKNIYYSLLFLLLWKLNLYMGNFKAESTYCKFTKLTYIMIYYGKFEL